MATSPHELKARASDLRRNMTDAERKLWSALRHKQLGCPFRRQVPLERYIVDFVCFERRLIIEVDGGQHNENRYDDVRDSWLRSQGFRILRFWNHNVLGNLEGVVRMIAQELGGDGALPST